MNELPLMVQKSGDYHLGCVFIDKTPRKYPGYATKNISPTKIEKSFGSTDLFHDKNQQQIIYQVNLAISSVT